MNDLISRQAAIDALTENKEMINAVLDSLTLDYNTRRNEEQRRGQINEDIETIKTLPSVQSERKKGRWFPDVAYYDEDGCPCIVSRCSECGEAYPESNFCPNCGAEMRGEANDSR